MCRDFFGIRQAMSTRKRLCIHIIRIAIVSFFIAKIKEYFCMIPSAHPMRERQQNYQSLILLTTMIYSK